MGKGKFTQNMTMHLNGGNEFSELHYKVLLDGKDTGITRHTRTNGSPKYKIIADEFHAGEDTFDVMETHGKGMKEWLEAHAAPRLRLVPDQ